LAVNSAAPTVVPGLVFAAGLDGHIRAYQAGNGAIIWDYNTAVASQTVNGVAGEGGAIDGPGPVVSRGMLFVNSGYGMFGEKPGNLLLAFGVHENIH
jgi:polyvinyl alcohol dehydrogenase (cytochrome)